MMHRFLVVTAMPMLLALAVTAPRAQTVSPALGKCVAEKDDVRRLACFDTEMARLAKQPAATVPSAEEKFGARGDLARDIEKKDPASEPRLVHLESTVTAIAQRPHGEMVVTLDNGQVWQQLTMAQSLRLRVGDKVTIKPGSLGSYSLVGPLRGAIKVKRLE